MKKLFLLIIFSILFLGCDTEDENFGSENESCYDNYTCNEGLICVKDVCINTSMMGKEGGACYGSNTCDEGLDCIQDICVDTTPVYPMGTEDGSCYANETCNEGFYCASNGLCFPSRVCEFLDEHFDSCYDCTIDSNCYETYSNLKINDYYKCQYNEVNDCVDFVELNPICPDDNNFEFIEDCIVLIRSCLTYQCYK